MKIVTQFDPTNPIFGGSLTTVPQGVISCQIPPGPGKILVFNQSLVNMIFTFNNAAYTDYVPSGTYRYFELSLPNWNITWSATSVNPNVSTNSAISNAISLVTVVSYEESELVPTIEPATSFVNPWDSQNYMGVDIQSTHWSGTGTTLFTLTSATFPGTMTYMAGLWLTTVPTAASADKGTLEVTITGIGGFGGTFKAYVYSDNQPGSQQQYTYVFAPQIPSTVPNTAIVVTGTKVATAGAGFSNVCAVTAQFYHV